MPQCVGKPINNPLHNHEWDQLQQAPAHYLCPRPVAACALHRSWVAVTSSGRLWHLRHSAEKACSLWGANPLQRPTLGPLHSSLGLLPALGEHPLLTPSNPHHKHPECRGAVCAPGSCRAPGRGWRMEWTLNSYSEPRPGLSTLSRQPL